VNKHVTKKYPSEKQRQPFLTASVLSIDAPDKEIFNGEESRMNTGMERKQENPEHL